MRKALPSDGLGSQCLRSASILQCPSRSGLDGLSGVELHFEGDALGASSERAASAQHHAIAGHVRGLFDVMGRPPANSAWQGIRSAPFDATFARHFQSGSFSVPKLVSTY